MALTELSRDRIVRCPPYLLLLGDALWLCKTGHLFALHCMQYSRRCCPTTATLDEKGKAGICRIGPEARASHAE
jgi:hypothetical protein